MPRFLIDRSEVKEGVVTLSAEESHHALRVMRLKIGDAVEMIDGEGGVFDGVVAGKKAGRLSVSVRQSRAAATLETVTLGMALIKPDRMDWLVEKACEIGVRAIVPVLTDRTTVRLARERWESKAARWKKIAAESCKQCGRGTVPDVSLPVRFSDMLGVFGKYDRVLLPTLARPGVSLDTALDDASQRTLVLIGPEGDFTEREARAACDQGAHCVTLGRSILRSETAALYVLSAIRLQKERLSVK